MYGPVIEGQLVRLRPPHPEDAVAMATWFDDLEVTRFIKLRNPPSVEQDRFIDGQWKDHILTEIMREDWEKANSV